MFELYYKADEDNTTNTRLCCDIYDKDNNFIIDFIQYERSDFNKWGKPKVLTDMILTRFYLPEIYRHISSKSKLKSYIKDNIDEDFSIIEKIEDMSKNKQRIVISLPTTIYPTRRGMPTSVRAAKDTHWPLIVKINDEDVSRAFMDFGDFGENAVSVAYQALLKGVMPSTAKDLFYIDGVKSLYDELRNEEMGN